MTGIPGESSNRGRAPFVGRAYETRELRDGFDRTLAGHGRVLLLVGEPGIGKSRLAEELEDEARERGALVLTGHCYEWEGAPAYWPWVQILRDCIRSVTADELEAAFGGVAPDIVRIMPELREAIPEVADPPDVNPEQARFRLFDGVTTGLRQLSGHQPLMILLEDLHWADEPSLLLLQFLAKEIADVPLLVVGTYRNVEIGRRHPLSRTLAELSRERRNRRIMLHGLEEADVAHYVALAGDDEADPELVTRIYRETEGNPFFVTEVVRLLADEGRLAAPNEPGDEWSLGIPESVRDVIGQRLEQLSDACNEMLSLAAAVGRDFDLRITGDAGQIEQEDLLALVDEATRAHVVAESATLGHYRFSHALIRELLYDELSSSERLRFHTRIADAIERQHAGNLAPYYADLAHHYALAPLGNNLDKAIEYALKAADQAMSAVAWETAITSYELALQLLTLQPQPDPYQECEILLGLGDAQNRAGAGQGTGAGRSEDGEATLWKAVDAARKSGSAEQLARAAIGIRGLNLYAPQGGNECLDLMEEALEQLPEEAGEFRALLLSRKAAGRWAYHSLQAFDAPRFTREQALIDVESALETATQTGSLTTLCEALLARFLILRGPDHTTRIEDAEEIAAVARRAESPQLILDALRTQVQALIGIGDYRTATWIVSQEMGTLVRELRIPLYEWQYNAFRAGLAFDAGQFDEAKRLASQAEQIWPESGSPRYLKIAISREEGRTEEFFENFPKHVQQYFITTTARPSTMSRALIRLETQRLDLALVDLDLLASMDFFDDIRGMVWLADLAMFSEVAIAVRHHDHATSLYDLLKPYANQNLTAAYAVHSHGSVAYHLGCLAGFLERWEDAEGHFALAEELHAEWGLRLYSAYNDYAWAEMLLRRGRAEDRERAHEMLERARAVAGDIGSLRLLKLIDELVPQPGTGSSKQPFGLTNREVEVLRLVARGRTDAEAAEELFISPRTVSQHLRNIYNKLGVNNRAEAAARAVEHGIA